MIFTTTEFGLIAQGMGIFVLACALVTGIAFVKKWSWRYRAVGVTSFSVLLTFGLFTLSLTPLTREVVTGAVPYTLVYDRSGPQAVITVPASITSEQLDATLRQAAVKLFSPGRNSQGQTEQLTIRARTILHPQPDVSQPVVLGQVKRSLRYRQDPNMVVQVFANELAKAQASVAQM